MVSFEALFRDAIMGLMGVFRCCLVIVPVIFATIGETRAEKRLVSKPKTKNE